MIQTLLVDDDEAILHLFSTALEINGFEVETAGSAAAAIAAMQTRQYEIVITDLRMEKPTSGFEVVREASKLVPRPIIVIVTAFPVPAAEWRRSGADALYVKGLSTMALPEQLKELMKHAAQAESAPHPLRRRR